MVLSDLIKNFYINKIIKPEKFQIRGMPRKEIKQEVKVEKEEIVEQQQEIIEKEEPEENIEESVVEISILRK